MNLPQVEFLGGALPNGWRRPTRGLVEKHLTDLREGLAPPSAPHLYRPSVRATPADLQAGPIAQGIQMLERYTRPGSGSPLSAVGMAYPQLARASTRSIRALAAQSGMRDLADQSRGQNVITLVNPTYRPVPSAGRIMRDEACFSAPGLGVHVERWKEIMLLIPGKRPRRVNGNDAWILQHEIDHLDGKVCVAVAHEQGRPIYFVPPEWSSTFYRHFSADWPIFQWAQYEAMKSGAFDLADYARYL